MVRSEKAVSPTELKVFKKTGGLSAGSVMWNHFYHRTIRHMGDTAHRLIPQKELSRLAHPFYHQLARGGEGYMEVGKNVYYTVNHLCHMVLALKPFGCMPSTQSDGVQSRVVNKFKDMIFLPVETSGEGEVNAHSRVQMALAEAKAKARAEFDGVLSETGKSLEELRAYVDEHPELKHALYKFPHRHGLAGTAAQFAWHVSDLMKKDRAYARRARPTAKRRWPDRRTGTACNRRPLSKTAFQGECMQQFLVGLDVGSTTVKAIVVDAATDKTIWQDYQRHETRQPEKVSRVSAPHGSRHRNQPAEHPHLYYRIGRRHHRRDGRRQIRPGSARRLPRRREAPSRGVLGHRAGRPGREDHRLQR